MSEEKKEEKKVEAAKKHFPSWRYHKSGKSKLVKSEEEDKALGAGWKHSPADHEEKPVDEKKEEKKADEKLVEPDSDGGLFGKGKKEKNK